MAAIVRATARLAAPVRPIASRALSCSAAASSSAAAAGDDKYDLVVVGGGPGGYVAAIKGAQLGMKVACVEGRGTLGGTCLNVGCIPSKALLHSSHMYHEAKHSFAGHGIMGGENVTMDVAQLQASKESAVTGLTGGIEHLFKKNKVDYVRGWGKLISGTEVSVSLSEGGNQTLAADNILLATGSEPSTIPPAPVDNAAGKIVDSTGALDIAEVPESMVVIGAGVIGLELGSVWNRLGTKVTVVEFLDGVCPGLDGELSKAFHRSLKKQGMKFKFKHGVTGTEVDEATGKVAVSMQNQKNDKEETIEADVVLVATGRRPFTDGLGLADVGILTNAQGQIPVDLHTFQTSIPSVRAIGDVIEGPMLAHKAEEEGIAAVEMIAGKVGHVNYEAIPGVIYTYPEVATVGKSEEELKEAGVAYNKGSFPFQANSRARTNHDSEGMVKILSDKETDRILGIHIMGPNAGEMIAEGVLGIEYGASSEDIARTCHAHPTLSEAFKEAAMAVYDKPIHF